MASLDEITEALRRGVAGREALGKSVKFDLKGEGFLFVDGEAVSNDDAPADCTIIVSRDDFEDLARGRLDPAAALMRGRLKIKGDMAVAMRLQMLLASALD